MIKSFCYYFVAFLDWIFNRPTAFFGVGTMLLAPALLFGGLLYLILSMGFILILMGIRREHLKVAKTKCTCNCDDCLAYRSVSIKRFDNF